MILPNHWVGINPKRKLPIINPPRITQAKDLYPKTSCNTCSHRAVDDQFIIKFDSNNPTEGWLIEGLRDAKREADSRPELCERIASHLSGFLNEIQTETQTEVVPHIQQVYCSKHGWEFKTVEQEQLCICLDYDKVNNET